MNGHASFFSHVFMAHISKSFYFRSDNLAIHFPWVAKMFQNKENLLHLPITQKTLSKDILVCLWFDIYWHCAMELFINWAFCVVETYKSGEENIFVFASSESLVVQQWTFCKSKRNIGKGDERSITVTFIINLHGTILPMQLICGEKTVQSLPTFDFPEGFPAVSVKIIK